MRLSLVLTRSLQLEQGSEAAVDIDQFLGRLEDSLIDKYARDVTRAGNVVAFKGGILSRVPGWSLLAPITSGTVEVARGAEGTRIIYRLNFAEQFLGITAITVAMAAVLLASGETWLPGSVAFPLLGVLWVWMVCGNCVLALRRFRTFLDRVRQS